MFYTTGANKASKIFERARERKEQERITKKAESQDIPEDDFSRAVAEISTDMGTEMQK